MSAAFLLAIVKAIPAAEQVLRQLITLYNHWLQTRNQHETDRKNARDDALIDGLASRMPKLCAQCPFGRDNAGQHDDAGPAPGVSQGGHGGS